MKTVIYYFTGTGNSLAAARKIAAALGDTELVPIASLAGTHGEIAPGAERVGIAFPVYFAGLPAMVASFAARLRPGQARYVFAVATYGGSGAASALLQLDGILRQHAVRGLDAEETRNPDAGGELLRRIIGAVPSRPPAEGGTGETTTGIPEAKL